MNELIDRWKAVCKTQSECRKGMIPSGCSICGWNASEVEQQLEAEAQAEDEALLNNCPKCGSPHTVWFGGDNIMNVGSGMQHYSHYKCLNCDHWWQEED